MLLFDFRQNNRYTMNSEHELEQQLRSDEKNLLKDLKKMYVTHRILVS